MGDIALQQSMNCPNNCADPQLCRCFPREQYPPPPGMYMSSPYSIMHNSLSLPSTGWPGYPANTQFNWVPQQPSSFHNLSPHNFHPASVNDSNDISPILQSALGDRTNQPLENVAAQAGQKRGRTQDTNSRPRKRTAPATTATARASSGTTQTSAISFESPPVPAVYGVGPSSSSPQIPNVAHPAFKDFGTKSDRAKGRTIVADDVWACVRALATDDRTQTIPLNEPILRKRPPEKEIMYLGCRFCR